MKKIFVLALAILLTVPLFAQYKTKKLVIPITSRSSAIGVALNVGDFVYIVADSAMYMSKVKAGAAATGTWLTADTSRYAVAKMADGRTALTVTTLTGSGNATIGGTLGVTGTTTLAGALNAAGACGFGTSNNKVTIAAATGNTAIAGTLGVTGATTLTTLGATSGSFTSSVTVVGNVGIGTTDVNKFTVAGTTGNTAIAGTLSTGKAITVGGAADTIPFYVYSQNGKKWKVSISNTGLLYTVTVTP